jgi:hypothetical protein
MLTWRKRMWVEEEEAGGDGENGGDGRDGRDGGDGGDGRDGRDGGDGENGGDGRDGGDGGDGENGGLSVGSMEDCDATPASTCRSSQWVQHAWPSTTR